MTSAIIGILVAAASSVGAYFAWKNSSGHQRKLAEEKVEEEERQRGEAEAEIEAAVYGQDDEKVNEIVSRLLQG